MKGGTKPRGFTIVEVVLFLAISGFLLVGLLIGVSTTIARQRYSDSVQDFTDFLRNVYSEVINVQNGRVGSSGVCPSEYGKWLIPQSNGKYKFKTGTPVSDWVAGTGSGQPGKTNCLIYGKLVIFGEDNGNNVSVFSLIGDELTDDQIKDLTDNKNGSPILALAATQTNIFTLNFEHPNPNKYTCTAGVIESNSYSLKWDARVETTTSVHGSKIMAMVIFRSPLTGTIHTYINESADIVSYLTNFEGGSLKNASENSNCFNPNADEGAGNLSNMEFFLDNSLSSKLGSFKTGEVNFCVGSNDILGLAHSRRNIRIVEDGRNATAVELVELDAERNECEI